MKKRDKSGTVGNLALKRGTTCPSKIGTVGKYVRALDQVINCMLCHGCCMDQLHDVCVMAAGSS